MFDTPQSTYDAVIVSCAPVSDLECRVDVLEFIDGNVESGAAIGTEEKWPVRALMMKRGWSSCET